MKTFVPLSLISFGFVQICFGHELCADFTAAFPRDGLYSTCPQYNGENSCIEPSNEGSQVTSVLNSYAIPASSASCAESMRKLTCVKLDAWSAHLFDTETGVPRRNPYMCTDFATELYENCKDVVMTNNPFLGGASAESPELITGTISAEFNTVETFLNTFAIDDSEFAYCTTGDPYTLPPTPPFQGNFGVCIEKLINLGFPNGIHINLVPIPGHPQLVVLGSHNGFAAIYKMHAPGQAPEKFATPLIDLSNQVAWSGNLQDERGLLGIAFHKDFQTNGRFFMSYSCGGSNPSTCGGNSNTAVKEFRVVDPATESGLTRSTQVPEKLIFSLQQPFSNHNGGQLLFRPSSDDPHLYLMLGDGGGSGDPNLVSQDPMNLLGKVLRLDIDSAPPQGMTYAIPSDNPFVGNSNVRPEVWALGMRNPWRCSFDRENPSYFLCGDAGQDKVEEVDVMVSGANYGWPKFEGSSDFKPSEQLGKGKIVTRHTPPAIEYRHDELSNVGSVTGGYIYRSKSDPQLEGKYIFADLRSKFFVAQENPPLSGQFGFSQFSIVCSENSPLDCSESQPNIFSFGEDNSADLYFLSELGVHRIVPRSNCGLVNEEVDVKMIVQPPSGGWLENHDAVLVGAVYNKAGENLGADFISWGPCTSAIKGDLVDGNFEFSFKAPKSAFLGQDRFEFKTVQYPTTEGGCNSPTYESGGNKVVDISTTGFVAAVYEYQFDQADLTIEPSTTTNSPTSSGTTSPPTSSPNTVSPTSSPNTATPTTSPVTAPPTTSVRMTFKVFAPSGGFSFNEARLVGNLYDDAGRSIGNDYLTWDPCSVSAVPGSLKSEAGNEYFEFVLNAIDIPSQHQLQLKVVGFNPSCNEPVWETGSNKLFYIPPSGLFETTVSYQFNSAQVLVPTGSRSLSFVVHPPQGTSEFGFDSAVITGGLYSTSGRNVGAPFIDWSPCNSVTIGNSALLASDGAFKLSMQVPIMFSADQAQLRFKLVGLPNAGDCKEVVWESGADKLLNIPISGFEDGVVEYQWNQAQVDVSPRKVSSRVEESNVAPIAVGSVVGVLCAVGIIALVYRARASSNPNSDLQDDTNPNSWVPNPDSELEGRKLSNV